MDGSETDARTQHNNIEAAEQMAQEIEREEGKDFRDLALDGILEKTKRQKSNDS